MSTARERFRAVLGGGTPPAPVYAPLFTALAARVGGTGYHGMSGDPALWSAALARTAGLFDLEAVCLAADPALLAEACGAPVTWAADRPTVAGPAPAIVETPQDARRLAAFLQTAQRAFAATDRARVAALSGPLLLAEQLCGADGAEAGLNSAKQVLNGALEALCASRPDLVVLIEGPTLGAAAPGGPLRRAYNTLKNVAGYFDVPLAVVLEGYAPDGLAAFAALPADVYVLGRAADGSLPAPTDAFPEARALGVCLPPLADDATHAALAQWRATKRPVFYTSLEPDTGGLDIDAVHAFVRALRAD
ncbi:MAG: hypothetical protein HY749_00410 [Gammaproteobacteria bacterium]|nr:hypothetical protein [Gammaproteobacteria bacterium]MBI5617100.1 hypothetical protein [Gammaproteobacteria bacterium]